MAITSQNVANSPTNSYPVGVFKLANGTELQGIVLTTSAGVEILTGGIIPVGPATFAVATETIVAGSASSQTLLAANTSRRFASICNDSTAILRIRLSSTAASATTFTIALINQYDYYELPAGYTGAVTGIWASATGSARITEG